MTQPHTTVRAISWLDLCPWLLLLRTPAIALRLEVLFLATLGGLLTSAAWWLAGIVFFYSGPPTADDVSASSDGPNLVRQQQAESFRALFGHLQSWPGTPALAERVRASDNTNIRNDVPFGAFAWDSLTGRADEPFHAAWRRLAGPYVEMFSLHITLRQFAYLLSGGLLTLAVWAVFGGAISRCAAMQLGREERIGMRASLWFAVERIVAYFSAPLYPLFGLALFCAAVAVLVGLPMNLDIGVLWAGVVWIFVLLCGALAALLALGLLFGWPLMWATVSSEGSDAFDALSRSFAYTFQRPLHYLFYVLVIGVLGALAWLLVLQLGEAIIHLAEWAAHWGVFDEQRMSDIVGAANGQTLPDEQLSSTADVGVWLMALGNGLVRAIAFSFAFGYFWVAASGIYLLLRREVDHTETDEIYVDDDGQTYGLPPLERDAHGVPGVGKNDPPPHSPIDGAEQLRSQEEAE
jgi:hypothetical protein